MQPLVYGLPVPPGTRSDIQTHDRDSNQWSQSSPGNYNQRGDSCLLNQSGRTGECIYRENSMYSTKPHNEILSLIGIWNTNSINNSLCILSWLNMWLTYPLLSTVSSQIIELSSKDFKKSILSLFDFKLSMPLLFNNSIPLKIYLDEIFNSRLP